MKNEKKAYAQKICAMLEEVYPVAECSLNYKEPYQLLIAARLSAQCTDARVNIITKDLFVRYDTLEKFANADLVELEGMIRTCGLFHTKAKSIIGMSQRLINNYGGVLPDTIDELLTLPGVGRKTANLIIGDIYGKPAIVTDTHCIRICGRLGLSEGKVPEKVEKQLREIIPPEKGSDFCHRLVLFGREICTAQSPKCDICVFDKICPKNDVIKKSPVKKKESHKK